MTKRTLQIFDGDGVPALLVKATVTSLGYCDADRFGERWEHTRYRVTISCAGRRMVVPYSMGMAHTTEPTLTQVLESVVSDWTTAGEYEDGFGDFVGFCDEYGYDTDSIKARALFDALIAQARSFERVFPSESRELLANALEYEPDAYADRIIETAVAR